MMNRDERMEVLNQAGVTTENLFNSKDLLESASKISMVVNGETIQLEKDEDGIFKLVEDIMNNGYVFNSRTDGRWVAAQTFKMLNKETWNRNKQKMEISWNSYLNNAYGYSYQLKMIVDELKRLSKMKEQDDKELEILKHFFTKSVCIELLESYKYQTKKYLTKLSNSKFKNIVYIKNLKGYHMKFTNRSHVIQFRDKHLKRIDSYIERFNNCGEYNYHLMKEIMSTFLNADAISLPRNTTKCNAWKDAFKAKGAYLTLMNIVKFHGVCIDDLNTVESVEYLENKFKEFAENNELWRFHKLLIDTLDKTGFNLFDDLN